MVEVLVVLALVWFVVQLLCFDLNGPFSGQHKMITLTQSRT